MCSLICLKCAAPGQVEDLEQFNLTADSVCIQWQQPYMCYNGKDSFEYHVSVEAVDIHELISVTFRQMGYCFPIDPCGSYMYMVTVTPSVQLYNGTMESLLVNDVGGTCKFPYNFHICSD